MGVPAINFDRIFDQLPPGVWAALSKRDHQVVAYGAEFLQVLTEAHNRGEAHPLRVKVPEHREMLAV